MRMGGTKKAIRRDHLIDVGCVRDPTHTDDVRPAECGKDAGCLSVIAEYCHRLDLAGIIDRACPIRTGVAILTHGQVIEALVANRLTSPAPLLRVTDWARTWAIEEVLGIDPTADRKSV